MAVTFLPSRLLKSLLVLVIIFAEIRTYRWWSGASDQTETVPAWISGATQSGKEVFKRNRVIVATSFGAHDDVFMSLVDTLESLLPASAIRVYTRGLRYGLGTAVLSELGIYAAPSVYYETDEALADVDAAWDGQGADVIVLGTCEIDMEFYSDRLWKLWEQRPKDNKFSLVCIVHNAGDFNWADNYSGDWARVGALRIMPISPSVSTEQFKNLMAYADLPSRYHLGYAHVPIHAHIPILPLENLASFNAHGVHTGEYVFSADGDGMGERRAAAPKKGEVVVAAKVGGAEGGTEEFWGVEESEVGVVESGETGVEGERVRDWGRRDGKALRDVGIQGNFETARRNYLQIFADLEAEIALNPSLWGYLPPTSPSSPFLPSLTPNSNTFRLHLVGNGDPDFIPSRLSPHVIKVHKGLSYLDFFSLMGSMDLILPAFTEGGGYYDRQASSTVAMAMQCEVPLLVTPRIFRAYSYLSPLTTVLRPSSLSEISAVAHLRFGSLLALSPPTTSATTPQVVFHPPASGYQHDSERSYTADGLKGSVSGGEVREEHDGVQKEVEEMIKRGWVRGEKGWRVFKRGVREGNREVVRKMVLGR